VLLVALLWVVVLLVRSGLAEWDCWCWHQRVRGGAAEGCEVLAGTDGGGESPDVSVALTGAGSSHVGGCL